MLTEAVRVDGAVPEVGLIVSQLASSVAVQLRAPPAQFVMLSDCGAGLEPSGEVKVRLAGLAQMDVPVIVSDTCTVSLAQQVDVSKSRNPTYVPGHNPLGKARSRGLLDPLNPDDGKTLNQDGGKKGLSRQLSLLLKKRVP